MLRGRDFRWAAVSNEGITTKRLLAVRRASSTTEVALADEYPKELDYTEMKSGRRQRLPKGKVSKCSKCGRNGLRQVSSWRKGRYNVTYWHRARKDKAGETPIALELCSVNASAIRGLPLAERDKGRTG
jgi:hypothetical protein